MQEEFDLQTPRDRLVNFEPSIVAKRQVVLTDQLEGQIISMYGRGMSYSDIGKHLQEKSMVIAYLPKVLPMLREWQQRPLSSLYVVAWLDAMYYKVRVDGKVTTKVLYSVIGLNLQGKKEVLGSFHQTVSISTFGFKNAYFKAMRPLLKILNTVE